MPITVAAVTAEHPRVRSGRTGRSASSLRTARIPRHASAVLEALHFSDPDPTRLRSLDDADWTKALAFCDAAQLTLLVGQLCREFLPEWVRVRIAGNYASNTLRFERLTEAALEI